jgi:uroporphyrinogen decarboxylase
LNAKIRAGCDAVQIFDTWASILSPTDFEEFSLQYIRYICENLETDGAPVIVFAKGVSSYKNLAELECDALGVDWTRNIGDVRREIGGAKALQGNLDPIMLFAPKEKIRLETERVLRSYGSGTGHIFNLGHGITPKTPVENVQYFVECVKELSVKDHEEKEEFLTTDAHRYTRIRKDKKKNIWKIKSALFFICIYVHLWIVNVLK